MRSDSFLEIKLSNLDYNLSLIKERTNQKILFMVKSNAYGHGLLQISEYAYQKTMIKDFGVADIGEAKLLYDHFHKLGFDNFSIFVFSNINFEDNRYAYLYQSEKVIPVIEAIRDLNLFFTTGFFKTSKLVLKFNTGMNRLGFSLKEMDEIEKILKDHNVHTIDHVMTHFANSYLPLKTKDKTQNQLEMFDLIIEKLKKRGFLIRDSSCSNSGAIEQKLESHHSYIRPGLMLYGPQSYFDKEKSIKWEGRNLSTLHTRIRKIVQIQKGDPVGYGSPVAYANGQMIYLPLGYGDGILTFYSGAILCIKEAKLKIFGRVNMDLTALLDESGHPFYEGEKINLWDESSYSINQFADATHTSAYQVMCAISSRVERIYK